MAAPSLGDSIRPAYLEIIETNPGVVDVVWKVPVIQDLPSTLWPVLPPAFKPSSPISTVETPDAVIHTWSMIGEPLAGQTIGIENLDAFTMDALFRAELIDGSIVRTVLRPAAPSFELPRTSEQPTFPARTKWIYPALFLAAFALSLTPSACNQRVVYCTAALLAGSLMGHTLGTTLPRHGPALSEMEARRIVQGLMLNTYRAFILDNDEEVYDVLARSVEGEVLQAVYLENRSRLTFDDPESAASLVDRLDVKSIDSMKRHPDGSITLLTVWDVYGSVFHWEHVHFRCNTFKADMTIVPAEAYWKISRLEILEEERVL